jgi:hypothetical protein
MSRLISNDPIQKSSRFRVLVNGSFEGASFGSLRKAIEALQARGGSNRCQIFDAKLRQNVWTQPRPSEQPCSGRFGLRCNGGFSGDSFDTLAAAIAAVPRGEIFNLYEVFEGDIRLFAFGLGVDPSKYSHGLEVASERLAPLLEEGDWAASRSV